MWEVCVYELDQEWQKRNKPNTLMNQRWAVLSASLPCRYPSAVCLPTEKSLQLQSARCKLHSLHSACDRFRSSSSWMELECYSLLNTWWLGSDKTLEASLPSDSPCLILHIIAIVRCHSYDGLWHKGRIRFSMALACQHAETLWVAGAVRKRQQTVSVYS